MPETRTKTKQTAADHQNTHGKKLSGKEIGMIALFVILLTTLTLKSFFFDEVDSLTPEEKHFKDFIEYSVARDYDGFFENPPWMVYRVIRIAMAEEDEKAVLRYEDPNTGSMVRIVQDGRYEADVRGYLLWILPIKEFSVTAEIEK